MAMKTPGQWTIVRADLSTVGQGIYDKIVNGWPIWEGSGSTTEDAVASAETLTLDGCTWVDDATYGWTLSHVAANNPGYLSTFDPPSKGSFIVLIYRDNNGTTEFPINHSAGQHTLIFTGTDACQARFGHNTTEVTGSGFTVNTWMMIENEWDATADTSELYLDGTSKDSKTSGINNPGSGTLQIGKKNPSGFLGKFAMMIELDDHLTAAERTALLADPWIWCRRERNLEATSAGAAGFSSADLAVDTAIAASSAGAATITADLVVDTALAATSAGVSGATADLAADTVLAATAAGAATVSADAAVDTTLAAGPAAVSTVAADLDVIAGSVDLAASVAAAGGLSADLAVDTALAATSAGAATASADAAIDTALAATSAAVSTVSAHLAAGDDLDAVVAGVSGASASLSVDTALAATTAAVSAATADLLRDRGLATTSDGAGTAVVDLAVDTVLAAQSDGAVTISATLTAEDGGLLATCAAISGATAALAVDTVLAAQADAVATITAELLDSYTIAGGERGMFYRNYSGKLIKGW